MLPTFVLSVLSCHVCLSVTLVWWPNGWMDQDETWHGGRPLPEPHCVRWGPSSPPHKKGTAPIVGPCLLWPNGWMDATWYGGKPGPRRHRVRGGVQLLIPKRGHISPHISAHILWPNGWMDQDVTW